MQACAGQQFTDSKNQELVIRFVVCLFEKDVLSNDPLAIGNECANQLFSGDWYGLTWQCSVDSRQMRIMLEMKSVTEDNYPHLRQCKWI